MEKIGVPDLLAFLSFFSLGILAAPSISLQYMSIGVEYYEHNMTLVKQCYNQHPKNETCKEIDDKIQSGLSSLQMIINILNGVFGPIVIFILGGISDRIGRKFPVIFIIALNLMWCICVLVNTLLPLSFPSYVFIFTNGIILGLSGGSAFTINTFLIAYVSVITHPQERTSRFATLLAVALLGNMAGPLLCGFILSISSKYYIIGVLATCIMLVDLILSLFTLKNVTDLEVSDEVKSTSEDLGIIPKFVEAVQFQYRNTRDMIIYQSNLAAFCGSILMYMLTTVGFSAPLVIIASVYVLGEPFNWDTAQRGYFMSGLVTILALQSLITVRILQCLKLTRPAITRVGIFFGVIGSFIMAFAGSNTILLLGVAITSFIVVASPAIQSMILSLVKESQTGAAMGLVGAVHTISESGLLNIVLYVYNHTRSIMNGMCFLAVSLFLVIDLVIALFYRHPQSPQPEAQIDDDLTTPIIPEDRSGEHSNIVRA